jgi:signal peptidase II
MKDNSEMSSKSKMAWLGVLILTGIEQSIKWIINARYLDRTFPIFPPLLYYQPVFNRDYSWFNSMLKLGIGKWVHIAFVLLLILLIVLFYCFIRRQMGPGRWLDTMFIFLMSGALCSLIDKVFWNGSLDYILLKGFFTFDLKDIFINVFIGLAAIGSIRYRERLKEMDDTKLLKDFMRYLLRKD